MHSPHILEKFIKNPIDAIVAVQALDKINYESKEGLASLQQTLQAMAKILKDGGKAFLGPFTSKQIKIIKGFLNEMPELQIYREIRHPIQIWDTPNRFVLHLIKTQSSG